MLVTDVKEFFAGLRMAGQFGFGIEVCEHPQIKSVDSHLQQANKKYSDKQKSALLAIMVTALEPEIASGKALNEFQGIPIAEFKQITTNYDKVWGVLSENLVGASSTVEEIMPLLKDMLENMEELGLVDSRLASARSADWKGAKCKHYFPTEKGILFYTQSREDSNSTFPFAIQLQPHAQSSISRSTSEILESALDEKIRYSVLRMISEANDAERRSVEGKEGRFYGVSVYDLNSIIGTNKYLSDFLCDNGFKRADGINTNPLRPYLSNVMSDLEKAGYLDYKLATRRDTNKQPGTRHYFLTTKGASFLTEKGYFPHAV